MSMDTKCDHARFCRVDRTYQSEQARITLAVDRAGVRDPVVSALQQWKQHGSMAEHHRPSCLANSNSAGRPSRQIGSDEGMLSVVSVWLGKRDHSSKPEGGGRWCGARQCNERMAMASRVNIAFPSRPLSPTFFGGTVFVGRRDARRKVCVADFFDVETNGATILSRCLSELWDSVSSGPSVGNSVSSGKRASGIFVVFLTTALRLGFLG